MKICPRQRASRSVKYTTSACYSSKQREAAAHQAGLPAHQKCWRSACTASVCGRDNDHADQRQNPDRFQEDLGQDKFWQEWLQIDDGEAFVHCRRAGAYLEEKAPAEDIAAMTDRCWIARLPLRPTLSPVTPGRQHYRRRRGSGAVAGWTVVYRHHRRQRQYALLVRSIMGEITDIAGEPTLVIHPSSMCAIRNPAYSRSSPTAKAARRPRAAIRRQIASV
jgi:hypothetical protein